MRRRIAILALLLATLGCEQLKKLDKVPDPGTLVIRSVPTGADISVDGLPEGKTPKTLESVGDGREHIRRVAISRSGYRTWRRQVSQLARAGQVITVYLQKDTGEVEDDEPVNEMVELEIRAPAGFKVEIDGLATGRETPLKDYMVKAGTHQIGLSARGKVHNYRVTLAAPGPAQLSIPRPGKPPKGNDSARLASYLGCTGCDGKPAPAAADPEAEVPALEELAAPAPEPEPEPEPAAEESALVELAINTQPPARVTVDGKDTGKRTPLFPGKGLKLSPGTHKLVFTTEDKASYIYEVTLEKGQPGKLLIRELGGPATGNVDALALGGGK